MANMIDLTLDCGDAQLLRAFWKTALGYVDEPPPRPFATREEWFASFDLPAGESVDDGAWLCDPEGRGPRLSLLKVPEPKTAKNRLHLDLQVTGGRHVDQAEREQLIEEMVAVLVEAGGAVSYRSMEGGVLDHVTMTDPEGNELCVV